MNSSSPHIPWQLIACVLQAEATAEQVDQIRQWREAAPENEARFREIERLWIMTGTVGNETQFDSHADWPKVKAMVQAEEGKGRWRMSPMRWAAAIAVLISVGLLLQWSFREPRIVWKEVVAMEQTMDVLLPEGSKVVLRKGSKLRYPEVFAETRREVKLVGEGWFEVVKDSLHPFVIQGPSLSVEVLGTSFTVRDVPSDSMAQVDVATGLVRVVAQDSLLLRADQSARRTKSSLHEIPQNPHFLAWQMGELRFENARIEEVLPALNRYYQVEFRLIGELPKARLTASFREESVEDVMEILRITLGVTTSRTSQIIELRTE